MVELLEGTVAYSIDVECVASGVQHHDRTIGQIALVNDASEKVLNLYVRPDVAVASYITPLTGLTAELLQEQGTTLDVALKTLRAHLPANATLVGQNILKDVEWLGLVEGRDFAAQVGRGSVPLSPYVRVHVCTCKAVRACLHCWSEGVQLSPVGH